MSKVFNKQKAAPKTEETPVKLIKMCSDCPIWVYRELVCNDNFQPLVIEGTPTPEELEEAAFFIVSEFSELTEGRGGIDPKLKEYLLRSSLVTLYFVCLQVISHDHYDNALAALREHGLSFEKPTNAKEKAAILEKIKSCMDSENVRLKESQKILDAYRPQKLAQSRMTVKAFNDRLASLESYFKGVTFDEEDEAAKLAQYIQMYHSIDRSEPINDKHHGRNI